MLKTLQQQVCLLLLKKTTNTHVNIYKWNVINSCFKTFTVVYRGMFNRATACQNSLYPQPKFWREHTSPLFAEHASGCRPILGKYHYSPVHCYVIFCKKKIYVMIKWGNNVLARNGPRWELIARQYWLQMGYVSNEVFCNINSKLPE